MKPIAWILLSWLVIISGNVHAADGTKQLLLGVLEEPQCSKTKDIRARIMFAFDETGWHTLTSPNLDVSEQIIGQEWTIGFDGKSLGTLMLNDSSPNLPKSSDWYFGRDKLYAYTGKVALIENPKKTFGGWCDPPTTRPLVLVSMQNVSDPEHWKPSPVGNKYKQELYKAFKLAVGGRDKLQGP
jgi:hypothetical protein